VAEKIVDIFHTYSIHTFACRTIFLFLAFVHSDLLLLQIQGPGSEENKEIDKIPHGDRAVADIQ
jgi:hypothetical protein